ncbi:hypothetical protein TNIN_212311 [Trichonephila inaurata madagascariensis]|uniref:Uncharacterized protein n=1 Tax=Trichonephila inaurata madagascariensis TaxID=2747483 RepID=A0A8X7BW86_9ARAC|nr:hypothetical protein TNIN_212311 [Trichonephila inaurata madagascariensis]
MHPYYKIGKNHSYNSLIVTFIIPIHFSTLQFSIQYLNISETERFKANSKFLPENDKNFYCSSSRTLPAVGYEGIMRLASPVSVLRDNFITALFLHALLNRRQTSWCMGTVFHLFYFTLNAILIPEECWNHSYNHPLLKTDARLESQGSGKRALLA